MNELLHRYTPEQQKTITDYWEAIRWTRKTGKIAVGVKQVEMEYWNQFDPVDVIQALEIHIDRYSDRKEHYTRGIIRNLEMEKSAKNKQKRMEPGGESNGSQSFRPAPAPQKKNRFNNYAQRNNDYEALSHLEMLLNAGMLTDEKREELKNDPRYAKYLK